VSGENLERCDICGREVERRRCIRKLTGHLPGPGPLRETWLRAMLDEV